MSFMRGKVFIDTNFLIYLFSEDDQIKKVHCTQLIDSLRDKVVLVWSTQVMQEFYRVMTVKHHIPPQVVKDILQLFDDFELVINNKETINTAIDIQTVNKISFWDSLVISAATQAKCTTILTEDLNSGQLIQGVYLQDPFKLDSP
ncbi:MAG: PIN domain-containing protein [Imperialibacter sp.]|uniref:PIN domain-containing protein n=1 Tax=Imperialibacter sp. TaxID=2038411 RepID=UPI0032EAF287